MAKLKIAPEVFSVHLIVRFLYCHFSTGNYFETPNIISQQARIYCVSLSIALGDLCVLFILTNWSCMELVIAHCMKIRTC